MNRYEVKLYVENGTDLDSVLANIGMNDNDLNGENGSDYLWWESEENGYNSNLEWLLDQIKNETSIECKVSKFLSLWFSHDDYYHDYEFNIDTFELKNGENVYSVAVAVNTYC